MDSWVVGSIVLACVFACAVAGMLLRRVLPEEHLNKDAADAIKMAVGLIATLAALVLGMLISGAKGSFDRMTNELVQGSARVVLLDRVLGKYGPETREMRAALKKGYGRRVEVLVSGDAAGLAELDSPEEVAEYEALLTAIGQLAPRDELQRGLRGRALQLVGELSSTRELALLQKDGSISTPMLVVLVVWLGIIFAGFGLFAPRNPTVLAALLLCALSAAGAIFLILEMDRPLDGLIRVSSAPLHSAVRQLGQ